MKEHSVYFDTMAQITAILAENINMQMEAEHADLFDRKMMALYGIQEGKPTRMDMATKLSSKARPQNRKRSKSKSKSPGKDLDDVLDVDYEIRKQRSQDSALDSEDPGDAITPIRRHHEKMESIASVQRLPDISGENIDDIRRTSGGELKREEMSITIDQ